VCRRGQPPDRYAQNFFLGFDHLIIDDAGNFMAEFKEISENWSGHRLIHADAEGSSPRRSG
jgi:hypothetical protein